MKPANILIAEDRRVKLVDLGTATAGHVTQITAENQVAGTLTYIAPERLIGESAGEPAADVYSLAVLAFEALAGRPPHRAENPRELLDQVLHEPPPHLIEEWPQAPVKLGRVLQEGMDPDPKRRQASAGELVRGLGAALPDPAIASQPFAVAPTQSMTMPTAQERRAPLPPPSRREEAEPTRRGGWLLPALACIGVLLAGGVWLASSGGGGESGTSGKRTAGARQAADDKRAGRPSTTSAAAAQTTPTTPAAAPPVAAPSASSSNPGATGAELNAEGYSLIQQDRYAEAIPLLRRAVASFPQETTDLNFAYALFNLGHALRMAGQPEAAIPILEQRLQIPDQRETVQAELDAARAAARQ